MDIGEEAREIVEDKERAWGKKMEKVNLAKVLRERHCRRN